MRQALFHIPLTEPWDLGVFGIWPGFGWFGILFWGWIAWHAWQLRTVFRANGNTLPSDWWQIAIPMGIGCVVIGELPGIAGPSLPHGIPIFGYGFMMLLGLVFGALAAAWRAKQIGLSPDLIWDLGTWLFFPGIVGARLFYLVQKRSEVFQGEFGWNWVISAVNLSNGGLVLYGGLIAGALGYWGFCRTYKLNPLLIGDLIMPSVLIGIGFGRLGCLLNGCCYGDRCDLPWGISFPQESMTFAELVHRGFLAPDAPATPLLHPTQIYSSIDGFLLAGVVALYFPYRRKNGDAMLVGWLTYPVTRFLIEFVRGDELGQFHTSFTIGQWVSLGIFATGVLFLGYRCWSEISASRKLVSA